MGSGLRTFVRAGLLFVVPTLLVCVAMLEVGLRLRGVVPSNSTEGLFQPWGNTYRLRPNMTKLLRTSAFSCTIYTNSFGLRDEAPVLRDLSQKPYFVFLGDSITFANGVDWGDSFVGVFARAAARRGYAVVNLGHGGHRLGEQQAVLEDFVKAAPRPPARVVVVFTKDLITGFDRDPSNLIVKDGYLFQRDDWVLPYLKVKLVDASAAYGFFRDTIRAIQGRLSSATRESALEFLRDFSRSTRWASPEMVRVFDDNLTRLDERIRGWGATPVYVFMPASPELAIDTYVAAAGRTVEEYAFDRFRDIVRGHARRAGVPFIDLRPRLQELQVTGEPLTFMNDPHYGPRANRVIGESLIAAMLAADDQADTATR